MLQAPMRNGRAFLFTGVSGAGKTTMASLAPPDAALLTDEISYVTGSSRTLRSGHHFSANWRGPEKVCKRPSRLCTCWLKARKIESTRIDGAAAVRGLLGNIFFFARGRRTGPVGFRCGLRLCRSCAGAPTDVRAECLRLGDDCMKKQLRGMGFGDRFARAGRRNDGHVRHRLHLIHAERSCVRDLGGGGWRYPAGRNRRE